MISRTYVSILISPYSQGAVDFHSNTDFTLVIIIAVFINESRIEGKSWLGFIVGRFKRQNNNIFVWFTLKGDCKFKFSKLEVGDGRNNERTSFFFKIIFIYFIICCRNEIIISKLLSLRTSIKKTSLITIGRLFSILSNRK